jgi:fumarylpyruvate hydrolase
VIVVSVRCGTTPPPRRAGFDQSAPVGAVTLASDLTKGVGVPPEAVMNLDVNGVSKQRSPAGKMIWDCAEIVAALSQLWDLVPGDIIFTGTPAGVRRP